MATWVKIKEGQLTICERDGEQDGFYADVIDVDCLDPDDLLRVMGEKFPLVTADEIWSVIRNFRMQGDGWKLSQTIAALQLRKREPEAKHPGVAEVAQLRELLREGHATMDWVGCAAKAQARIKELENELRISRQAIDDYKADITRLKSELAERLKNITEVRAVKYAEQMRYEAEVASLREEIKRLEPVKVKSAQPPAESLCDSLRAMIDAKPKAKVAICGKEIYNYMAWPEFKGFHSKYWRIEIVPDWDRPNRMDVYE